MNSLSGCTVIRNGIRLGYPIRPSILSYLPICDEVVVAYDPTSDDSTQESLVEFSRQHPKIRLVPSKWDLANKSDGSEIAVQSNFAFEQCNGVFILYVQADEAIHESDYGAIRELLKQSDVTGATFQRSSFDLTLSREIIDHRVDGLLRLFKNGSAYAVGDGMTCKPLNRRTAVIVNSKLRLFNYSRVGAEEEVVAREANLHSFYHSSDSKIRQLVQARPTYSIQSADPAVHPECIQSHFKVPVLPPQPRALAALVLLLGAGEHQNLVSLIWQFRDWPGEFVVIDDMTSDDSVEVLRKLCEIVAGGNVAPLTIIRRPLNNDFASARNYGHETASAPWILHADADETWDPLLVKSIDRLTAQLDRDQKRVCGFPRANFLDGVLVNDVPDRFWSEEGLRKTIRSTVWPPSNSDVQFRLLRKEERWEGAVHERPVRTGLKDDSVVVVNEHLILHNKSLARQRSQDSLYRTCGITSGMQALAGHDSSLVTLLTAASSEYWPVLARTLPNKLEYCLRHKFSLVAKRHVDFRCWMEREAYMLGTLEQFNTEWLFFMGADTLIMNQSFSLSEMLDRNYDFIISKDCHGINNDVFLLQNTLAAKAFLRAVMSKSQVNNDQDAMKLVIQNKEIEGLRVKYINQRAFNSYVHGLYGLVYPEGEFAPGDFVLHFPGLSIAQRIELIDQYLPRVIR